MSTDMLQYFGMKSFPFGKEIESFHAYTQFNEIKDLLSISLPLKTMTLITGQAGAGKTTAVRSVLESLPSNTHAVIYLGHDQQGNALTRRLCMSLGLKPKHNRGQQLLQVGQYLLENQSESGRSITLVIDECHLLDLPTLEDLRMLTNSEFDSSSPISIILIGQLSFRRQLKAPGYEAVNQRIAFRYALEGLSLEETSDYIKHRLKLAGASEDIFLADGIRQIFAASGGIPREINNLCVACLVKAHSLGAKKIDAKIVKQVLEMKEVL